MTAREELRSAATFLERLATIQSLDEGLPEFLRYKATALRQLATRLDEEEAAASKPGAVSLPVVGKAMRATAVYKAILADVLARLDATLEEK